MSGETPMHEPFETLARSHARSILRGRSTLDDVPAYPIGLRARVEYLIS